MFNLKLLHEQVEKNARLVRELETRVEVLEQRLEKYREVETDPEEQTLLRDLEHGMEGLGITMPD